MNIAVVGSRNFRDYTFLSKILSKVSNITSIVSGGADGADSLAEQYAELHGIRLKLFLPEYEKYGKSAPIIRNRDIISNADMCIAFWDGKSRGTKHTISLAKKRAIPTEVYVL